jgi:Gluconate 2-dehydrogenase subunit 3
VTALADTLIPRTDTPGALQAGVPATFSQLIRDWAKPQNAADFMASLAALDQAAKTETGKAFALLPRKQRTAFLTRYDAAHLRSDKGYTKLKLLLMTLFYMSEPGATQDLRYEHVPGAWQASIPLTPKTRTWAA